MALSLDPTLVHSLNVRGSVLAFCCAEGSLYCGSNNDIQVWNLQSLSLDKVMSGHKGTINALCAAEEHHWLISSSADDTVIIWGTNTKTPLYTISTAAYSLGNVYSLCWVSELSLLFMGCQDASIVWLSPPTEGQQPKDRKCASGTPSYLISGYSSPRRDALPHKFFDSLSAADRARSALGLFQAPSMQGSLSSSSSSGSGAPAPAHTLGAPLSRTSSSSSLGSSSRNDSPPVLTVSLPQNEHPHLPGWSRAGPGPLAIHPPAATAGGLGHYASAPVSPNMTPQYTGVVEPEPLHMDRNDCVAYAHNGYIYSIVRAHRHDKVILATAGGDGHVCLWVLELGDEHNRGFSKLKRLKRLNEHDQDQAVYCLAYREGTLFGGCQGGTIKIWDLETYQCIRTIEAHETDVLTLDIMSGDLLSGAANGEVKTVLKRWNPSFQCTSKWQAHQGVLLASIVKRTPIPAWHHTPLYLTGGSDQHIKVWNVPRSSDPGESVSRTRSLESRVFQLLADFVAFPSISAEEKHREDCRRCAHFLQKAFVSLGAESDLLPVSSNNNPLVLATFRANKRKGSPEKRKRILFYGHYDVISPGNVKNWTSPPFSVEGRDGCVYGRGVADQKGPTVAAMLAVADLHGKNNLTCDVVFAIEGEEECGSAGFQNAVRAGKEQIGSIDVILVSNSHWMTDDIPSVTWALRGVVHANVSVRAPQLDVHSGVSGGSVAEPLVDMTRLLATLTSSDNRVSIDGFYDRVRKLSAEEGEAYEDVLRRTSKDGPNKEQEYRSLLSRWREPSLSLHEIKTSSRNRTIIPSWASADLSVRIVPDQDLEQVCRDLKHHLESAFEKMSSSNDLEVKVTPTADWWMANRNSVFNSLLSRSVAEEWGGIQPLWVREGGSIPSIPFLEQLLDAPAVHFPMSQSSDGAHLPNERVRVLNLDKGINILRRWISGVGEL